MTVGLLNPAFVALLNSGINPTLTVTTQGTDGVAEQFTVSGGTDEVVEFSDGAFGGSVTFDAMGNASGSMPPGGYSQQGSTGFPSLTFVADAVGVKSDQAKTSGGGGDVTIDVQGVDPLQEVLALSFDGAIGGAVKITGDALTTGFIPWNASAAEVEAELEATFGTGFAVTGSAGEFEIVFDDGGARTDYTLTGSTLTTSWYPNSPESAVLAAWYDLGDYSLLWKDTGATSPASALDDVIRRFDPNPLTPLAPNLQSPSSGASGLVKAISGGVGSGIKLDGSDDHYVSSDATFFDFMHQDGEGFCLLLGLAYTDADSGTRQCHFSTCDDNAEVGILAELNDSGTAFGAWYGWIGPNVAFEFGGQGDNAKGTSLTAFMTAWENGFTGDDLVAQLGATQIVTKNTTGTPSGSSSAHSATFGARAGGLTNFLKATVGHILIYRGRPSSTDIADAIAWLASQ